MSKTFAPDVFPSASLNTYTCRYTLQSQSMANAEERGSLALVRSFSEHLQGDPYAILHCKTAFRAGRLHAYTKGVSAYR